MLMMTEMKSSSITTAVIVLLLSSSVVFGLGSVVYMKYKYHTTHCTWHEAQYYCRLHYRDLAVLRRLSDRDTMNILQYHAYIGLLRPDLEEDVWLWTNGERENFIFWAKDEPHESDACAAIYYNTFRIYGHHCQSSYFFICQKKINNRSQYEFIPLSMTWSKAQNYCREHYDDLARFPFSFTGNNVAHENFPVWIGLHREDQTWKWSSGFSDYRDWDQNEPDNSNKCVSISSFEKKMSARNCTDLFPFCCYADNIVMVKENKTWEEALEHCRSLTSPTDSQHRYDMLSVQPGDDQDYIMAWVNEGDTEEVWVSLRFLAGVWLWVNGADLLYRDLPACPLERKHCGALSMDNVSSVQTRDCTERKNFLCYRK